MEITGKILQLLEPKSGQSARGSWKKQDFILETNDQFPKKVCISNWNDKVDIENIKPGTEVTAHINIESREYNGNWYTDVKVWKMDTSTAAATKEGDLPGIPGNTDAPPWDLEPDDSGQGEDLPF